MGEGTYGTPSWSLHIQMKIADLPLGKVIRHSGTDSFTKTLKSHQGSM